MAPSMPRDWATPANRPPLISDTQIAKLHTASGIPIRDFTSELVDVTWSREYRQVSRCTATVPSAFDIQPWLHWLSVWDDTGQELYWKGPVQKSETNDTTTRLTCFDIASFYTRTRCPISQQWAHEDPADIADELVSKMIDHHGLPDRPIVRHDPYGDKFDFTVEVDAAMLDSHIDDLVGRGLSWTVVSGVPIFGPLPRTAIATLDRDDFVGAGMTLVRDGTKTFNDVLVRSQTPDARAIVPMGGLALQTIYEVDSVSSMSNADAATKQYARDVSKIHQRVQLPSNAVLDPKAPLRIGQLIPTARLNIDAFGVRLPVMLTGVDVSCTPGASTVSIRVEAVDDDLPELIKLQERKRVSK